MSSAELEKIVKLESNVASGKVLDEEQLILYSSKNSVEKAIADIGQLKDQLEEVSAQERALAQASKVVAAVETNKTEEVSTETFSIEQSSTSTQYETAEEPKTLLGQTSLGGFDVALEGSLRSAGTYLNDELSPQAEFMRGFSYSQMADLVDSLAHDMSIGNNNLSFASLSGAVDKLQQVSSPVPQQSPVPAPVEEEEVEEVALEEEVVEQPVEVQVEVSVPVVQEVERKEQARRPPARERGPPRVNTQPTDGAQAEPKEKERRERTPRERVRKPVAGAATTEHPPEHQTGKRDFGAHVPKPAHDAVAEEHAARHAHHPDGKESTGAAASSDEKRKRGPRARKPREPREGGEASAATAAPAAPQTHEAPVTHKPVAHSAAPTPSGPPAKVWGGDNKIKSTHAPAPVVDAARSAHKPSAGPTSEHAAPSREHAPRGPRPVVKSAGGAAPSSGDRFRSSSSGAPRPPRPPRDPAAVGASGDASSGPPPARRPQTSSGAPRPPRPSGPPAKRKPQAPRPPKPVAATA
eukprot:gene25797-32289_t